MQYVGEIYAGLTGLVWATAVILFRKSGYSIVPQALNMFKNVVALLFFVPTFWLAGIAFFPAVPLSDWLLLILSGAIGIALGDTLFFASLNRLGAGLSAVVDCLYCPSVIFFAFLLLGERLSVADYLGAALVVGAVLLTYSKKRYAEISQRDFFIGVGLGALAMALMGLGIVIAKPILERTDVLWATTVRLVAGIFCLAPITLAKKQRQTILACFRPSTVWRVSLPASFLGGYLAMLLWVAGYKYALSGVASILNQLSSVFLIILAYFFLAEALTVRKISAVLLATFGIMVLLLF